MNWRDDQTPTNIRQRLRDAGYVSVPKTGKSPAIESVLDDQCPSVLS